MGAWLFSVAAILVFPLGGVFLAYMLDVARGRTPSPYELAQWVMSPRLILVQVISTIPSHLATLAFCWAIVTKVGKRPFWKTLGSSWPERSEAFKVTFVFGVVVGMFILDVLLNRLLPPSKETAFDQMLKASPQVRVAVALLAVVTAPLVEEVVYRGVLFSGLRSRVGAIPSVIAVSVLFAGVHFPQYWGAWSSLAGITVLSVALTAIRARSKSIAPCIAIHLSYNFIGAFFILLARDSP
jgi:membrane protease YdiL (CAAX protease family)